MTKAVSLKLKYAGAVFFAVLFAAVVVIALLAWQQRLDSKRIGVLAQAAARENTARELEARAGAIARHAAETAGAILSTGGEAALSSKLQAFQDDPTLTSITVHSAAGRTLYEWQRPNATMVEGA